jgi:hypothetical protein
MLDTSTKATTAGLPLKIIGFVAASRQRDRRACEGLGENQLSALKSPA